jgi:hypothetical protein
VDRWLVRLTALAVVIIGLVVATQTDQRVYVEPDRTPGTIGGLENDGRGEPWGNRAIADPPVEAVVTSGQVTRTDALKPFEETLRIGPQDKGRVFDRTPVECHGGSLAITWHIGNIEGVTEYTGIHLGIEFDGDLVATAIKGAPDRTHVDDVTSILATVDYCAPGMHTFGLRVVNITGVWGFPYVVNPGDDSHGIRILRGFLIQEVH